MKDKIKKIAENIYEIEKTEGMFVPAIVFASEKLMKQIEKDKTLQQIRNVAKLPGIIKNALIMPDAHQGYGLPIGGVAAFDLKKGIISPGGVGYDINCGVRLLTSNISKADFLEKRVALINEIDKLVPSGVGEGGEFKLDDITISQVLNEGVLWAKENGYATKEDIERTEDNGCIKGADSTKVSQRAKARGKLQLGTLGAGNHFLEIQEVETIFDEKTSKKLNLNKDNITVMIHTGSRGLGHQTASDYIQAMEKEYGNRKKRYGNRKKRF
jgi:tRNA-splicing ligase RtcB